MNENQSNGIIVITGASKGLGRETAFRLCRRYPDLVLVARDGDRLERLRADIARITGRAPLTVPCDVSNEVEAARTAEIIRGRFGRADVLVNNAGIGIHKTSENLSNEEMRKQFEVNFFGPFYLVKALLPLLKKSDSPYILNVGSLAALAPFADNVAYAATKCALSGFSEGLRRELKPYGIRVGVFLPGPMKTEFRRDVGAASGVPSFMVIDPEKAAVKLEKMIDGRRKEIRMYLWLLLLMKIKRTMKA